MPTLLRKNNMLVRSYIIVITYKALIFYIKTLRQLPSGVHYPLSNQMIFFRYINRDNTSLQHLSKLHIKFWLILMSLDLCDYYSYRELVPKTQEWYGCHHGLCFKIFILLSGLLYIFGCSISFKLRILLVHVMINIILKFILHFYALILIIHRRMVLYLATSWLN